MNADKQTLSRMKSPRCYFTAKHYQWLIAIHQVQDDQQYIKNGFLSSLTKVLDLDYCTLLFIINNIVQ